MQGDGIFSQHHTLPLTNMWCDTAAIQCIFLSFFPFLFHSLTALFHSLTALFHSLTALFLTCLPPARTLPRRHVAPHHPCHVASHFPCPQPSLQLNDFPSLPSLWEFEMSQNWCSGTEGLNTRGLWTAHDIPGAVGQKDWCPPLHLLLYKYPPTPPIHYP